MPRQTTRKHTLRKPTVRKKTVRKRKTTARKATASKRVVRKAVTRKPVLRKAVSSKAKVRKKAASKVVASKAIVRKPAKRRERIDRVEAKLDTVSTAHKTTRSNLDETRAILNITAAMQKENTAGLKKTRVNLDELRVEVRETSASVRELRKSIGGLDGKWGDFSEALLIGDVEKALNEFKGIAVNARHPNVEITYKGKTWEIDCLAVGNDMVVVVEAKASLTKGHVGKFIGNILERFTDMSPAYRGMKIYGAVGYLNAKDDAVTFAQRKGLLVLRSVHKTKEIVHVPSKFKLRNFHP